MGVRTGRPVGRALAKARQDSGSRVLIDQYSTSKYSPYFEVRDLPVVLQLFGATNGEQIRLLAVHTGAVYAVAQPFLLKGKPVVLSQENSSVVLSTSGRYRVELLGELGNAVCTYRPQQTADRVRDIEQPSGAQANRPNLFLDGKTPRNKSHIIEVQDVAWVFNAYGLQPGEYIETLAVYGSGPDYREELYIHNGSAKELTAERNAISLDVSGRYRFKLVGDPEGKVLVGNPTILSTVAEGSTEGVPGPAGPRGPQGEPGPQGERGADGQIRFTGMGPPPTAIVGARPGDTYMDLTTGDVYKLT